MRKIYLKRFYRDIDRCLGVWTMDELEWPLFTLEPSWKENKLDISCIPTMVYILWPFDSPQHGKCFVIKDVPKRTVIEVHVGNWVKQTEGCILIGQGIGQLNGEIGITDSTNALHLLLDIIKEPRELYISNSW